MTNIVKSIEKRFNNKNFDINSVLDLGDYYVFSIVPKKIQSDEYYLDGLFKIDKQFKDFDEFNLEMDRQKYLNALKNPLYVRGK